MIHHPISDSAVLKVIVEVVFVQTWFNILLMMFNFTGVLVHVYCAMLC